MIHLGEAAIGFLNSILRILRSKLFWFLVIVLFALLRPTLRNTWHNSQHTDLFVASTGQGPSVVLLHGLTGTHKYWQPLTEELHSRFTVLTPDLQGFGRSHWPDRGYELDEQLDRLAEISPTDPFILVGHSLGALLATQFSKKWPERVRALVLLAPPSLSSRQELKEILDQKSEIESIMSLDSLWAPLACHIHEILGPLSYYLYRPYTSPSLPDDLVREATLHRWESYNENLNEVVLKYPFMQNMQNLPDQTLLLLGRDDLYTKNSDLIDKVPNTIVVEGGHNFLWDNTDKVLAVIDRFLSGLE